MNNEAKTNFKVGLTVLISIILLIAIITWTNDYSFTDSNNIIKVEFETTFGIEIGDPVTVRGIKKGKVVDIELIDNKALVSILLENGIKLNSDASFSLMMLDLMGGKKIDINPGISGVELDYSQILKGKFLGDISSAMAMLTSVQNDLVTMVKNVNISLSKLNSVLADDNFISGIKETVVNVKETTGELKTFVKENRNDIKSLIKNTGNLVSSLDSLTAKLAPELSRNSNELSILLNNGNEVIKKLDELLRTINSKDGNINKLLTDKELFLNLKKSLNNTNKLLEILLEQIQNEGINVDANIF